VGLRTLHNGSLLAAGLISFGNLFHYLGADAQNNFSLYIAVWLLATSKVTRTQITAVLLAYPFGSDHLDTVVLFHSVL